MRTRLEVFQSRRLGRCKITTVFFIPMATMTETLLAAKAASGLGFAQLASRSPSRAFQQRHNQGVHIDMARVTAIGIRNQGVGLQKAEQLGKAATWWFGTHPAGATPHQVGLQLQGFIPAEFPRLLASRVGRRR